MAGTASISNSYATGSVAASSCCGGGLVGGITSGNSITGKNYYVDMDGTNGIGYLPMGVTCSNAVCIQAMGTMRLPFKVDTLFLYKSRSISSCLHWCFII